ncbi:hypothetical protein ACFTWD_35835 [Streptomyces sp. NPDC056943]|uniref:hypothetical protein n=1 Tax=Streptomyces sp. NPDC056943 TaxID=3345971 RepID=UPI0036423452
MALRVKWSFPGGAGGERDIPGITPDSSAEDIYRAVAPVVIAVSRGLGTDEDVLAAIDLDEEANNPRDGSLWRMPGILVRHGIWGWFDSSSKMHATVTLYGPDGEQHRDPDYEVGTVIGGNADLIAAAGALAVPAIGFIAGTMFQEALQRAASDSYDGARRFFTSLRTRVRRSSTAPPGAEVELIIVRSEDGRWRLHLPGDLEHEAHAALIRDFDTLIKDEGDGQRFTVEWSDGRWVKSSRGGR